MTLTSPAGTLLLNQEVANLGAFFLDGDGCKFNIGVRSTKDHVPQADGDILHHRFLTGTEMPLKIQLWESAERNKVACDALLELMLDTLTRNKTVSTGPQLRDGNHSCDPNPFQRVQQHHFVIPRCSVLRPSGWKQPS